MPSEISADSIPQETPISPMQAMFRVLTQPEDTFRRLPEKTPFLLPGLVQTVVYIIVGIIALRSIPAIHGAVPPPATAKSITGVISVIGVITGAVTPWLRWAVVALAYYLVGFLVSPGKNGYGKWYNIAVLASLPGLLGIITMTLLSFLIPSGHTIASLMAKNASISAAAFLPVSALPTWIGQFLTQFNPFTFWYLALATVGYSVYGGIPRGKAVTVVVGLWLLEILAMATVGSLGAGLVGGVH